MIRLLALALALFGLALPTASAQGFKVPADLVKASLVGEPAAIRPGEPFTVGIRLVMRPHWHVYWRNPGDSGLAPEVAWTLPPGFSAGPIQWPSPSRIPVAHLMNYGYEDEAVLLAQVTPPATLASAKPVTLQAKLTYLVCERECVPGSAELRLTLPVAQTGTSTGVAPGSMMLFEAARAALPAPAPWPVRYGAENGRLQVHLAAPAGLAASDVAYFPYAETAIENAAPQEARSDADGLHIDLARGDATAAAPATLPGVLTFAEATPDGPVRRAYAVGEAPDATAVATASAATTNAAMAPTPAQAPAESLTLWSAAGLAFLGGLLLNLMPCVFPVLSIKVLSLVRHSGEPAGRVRLHGLAYTAGVLASFLALAGLLIALKGAGAGIGWGFQLQSPLVVAGLAYLLLAMGLSLSGVVHLGAGIAGLGDGLTRRAGLEGSFFTGILATVVATPCTAPFMGSAVGFALTQEAGVSLAVFASLGLGLALPFLALTIWPAALRRLPRPGAWMDTLKGALAFPIYATVAWLVWVLSQQVGSAGLLAALVGLVLVGLAAWAWERGHGAGPAGTWVARGTAVAALAALAILTLGLDRDRAGADAAQADGSAFTQARLDGLLAQGKPVFVNMTAAWCITCQVNERVALRAEAVQAGLKARGITALKGDWTNQNPEITRLLERHGRSGVPLYLLYAGAGEPTVLPQILTPGLVLEALQAVPLAAADRSAALTEVRP
ncbi:protein-disulfide reductase DsbD domain-containing protein [Methylobacterium sp. Leaf88]|uniref:protein-disulfide reductase DsbD family protein n=1 Tax=Methylobacterium sp. Leaf88 TaxID=1736244 RepID=UPI0006F440E7|nr:protein-disulfide reductase DsbD domain-containing protein [Methylobacterium sp. Leaf88]KQO70000.1 thiol:disulfide interchange protein [Methylobacterium sp. Leaf88]